MSDDGKIHYSKVADPEKFPEMTVEEYEPCECGRTMEQAVPFGTVMVKMLFVGDRFTRQIICAECYSK